MTKMMEIVQKARSAGYEPELIGKLLKLSDCSQCEKKTLVVFVKGNDKIFACPCGYKDRESKPTNIQEYRCAAYTKKGVRCSNPPKFGRKYCGVHQR